MVGASLRGALGRGAGPRVRYCTPERFRRIKRPHLETLELLRRAGCGSGQCLIWSTCSRYELYAYPGSACAVDRLRSLIGEGEQLTELRGDAARLHLLRTAAGLNSGLAGDAEVGDQLFSALRTAGHAGAGGPRIESLVLETERAVRELRERTAWGRFMHRYCDVALARLAPAIGPALGGACLAIGGSTTSASVLESLGERFGVPQERLGLVYRGSRKGRLADRLHAAVGNGRRLVVQDYRDPRVMRAVGEADAVFFAVDVRDPVAGLDELARCRDLARRPMVAVDFNTLGSVRGAGGRPAAAGLRFIDAGAVDAEVAAFNTRVLASEEFNRALREAEGWIRSCLGLPGPADGTPRRRGAGRRHTAIVHVGSAS